MIKKFAMLICVVASIAMTTTVNAQSQSVGQSRTVGHRWPAEKLAPIDQVDHSVFDQLLKKYVNTDGQVNYQAWHQSTADRDALKSYLDTLSCANSDLQSGRAAILSYWINAYNAVTIEAILRVYPTTTIRNHTSETGGYNIWKTLKFNAGQKQVSLEDIEHKILRKMGEPRVHFAIVCASIGCPRLLNEAYVPSRLADQLALNTKDFFSRPQNLQVNGNTLMMSKIISWFGTDFGPSQQQQVQVLSKYFPQQAQQVAASGNYGVGFLEYDWNLNTQ